ncbi:hypothetical protein ACIPX0_04740 [Streptomyces sp. NPDC090075]|uniref:hypothetical protein n=1 Tax=Streptomyces sp. NPDC090075 TaxID=3365937 RepID=UPI0038066528
MTAGAVASRPAWLQEPTLAWRPAVHGVVLCARPHDLADCLGPNAVGAAVAVGPPAAGHDHLCGLQELLAVLLPAVREARPEVPERHAEVLALLTRPQDAQAPRGRFVPVSETASLGTTRRISRESHITAGWIDRAARFLVDALPALGERPVLVLDAFDRWDRISVRILYRTVLLADQQGRGITVRGLLKDGGSLFLERLSGQRAVGVCGVLPPVAETLPGAPGVPGLAVEPWHSDGSAGPLRAIGDAIALQNFERADLLIAAHLAAVGGDPLRADDTADLIRLQAISEAQTGRIDSAVAKLERSLELAGKPELRAHLNYLVALLVTKRKDDTDAARTFYLRGLECLDELAEPGVDAQVERAWILNGLALAAAIDARETSDAERRDELFQSAFELEFDAFRMVREMPGDSAFYLRYNLSHNLAFLLQITGRHRQAEEFLRSVSATMLGTGRPEFFVPHHYAIAVLQLRRGSHEEAAASFAAAVRVAHSLRDPFHLEKLLAAAGYTDLRRGDHPGAARHYRDAARTARRLCDETAFAQDLAGLLWALTLQGARWDRHTLAAARIWYPEAAGAYDRGAGRDELAEALTAAGADIAPPSSKLPSYLPAVDLEGLPGRDLNRFLAGITTRENPSALLTQNTAEGTGRAGEAPETGGPERGWAAAREAARPGDVAAREAADPDAAVAQRAAGPDGAVAWGAAAPSAVTAREVADPGGAVAQRVAGPDGRVARGLASPGEAVAREPASPDTAVAREPASPDTAVAREPAVPGVTVVDGVAGSGRVVVGGGWA